MIFWLSIMRFWSLRDGKLKAKTRNEMLSESCRRLSSSGARLFLNPSSHGDFWISLCPLSLHWNSNEARSPFCEDIAEPLTRLLISPQKKSFRVVPKPQRNYKSVNKLQSEICAKASRTDFSFRKVTVNDVERKKKRNGKTSIIDNKQVWRDNFFVDVVSWINKDMHVDIDMYA